MPLHLFNPADAPRSLAEPPITPEEDANEEHNLTDPGCLDETNARGGHSQNLDQNIGNGDAGPCLEDLFENTRLAELRLAQDFIRELKNATLDGVHCGLNPESLSRLRNPPTVPFTLDDQPDLRLSFELFLASLKASVDVYNTSRKAILRRHPEDNILSYEQMKKALTEITGVASIVHPMCPNSCVAFTGPLMDLDHCPRCKEPKRCPTSGKFQQEFHTMPIGPILQALWRDPESARRFNYRRSKTQEIIETLHSNSGKLPAYEDFFHGSDYLEHIRSGIITDNDIILMFSIDGAQLYAHKASDCWIYLWVILDFSPEERYESFLKKKASSLILWGAKTPMFIFLTPGNVAVLICDRITGPCIATIPGCYVS